MFIICLTLGLRYELATKLKTIARFVSIAFRHRKRRKVIVLNICVNSLMQNNLGFQWGL